MKFTFATTLMVAGAVAACAHEEPVTQTKSGAIAGTEFTVRAGSAPGYVRAPATAEAYARATLSTKLMGTVTAVHAREGDLVRAGQPLVSIDARDLTAKVAQVEAGIAEAEAMQREARMQANRMRALFAEDAAPRAQVDAAETGLARADAAVNAARSARAELQATRGYSVVRAPFDAIITSRMVDPGAFAAPGAPLMTVQDARRLRVVATATPAAARSVQRGSQVQVEVEGVAAVGMVEAIVPTAGNLYHINVIIDNRGGSFLPGSAAALLLPQIGRPTMRIPQAAIQNAGDLTGVYVRNGNTTTLRWVQLGEFTGNEVEVLAGLRENEVIVIPATGVGVR